MTAHIPHQHRRADDPEIPIPPGMTAEQLDFFTEQTERAVNKAHELALAADKKRSRHRTIGFCVLFLAFLGNVLWSNHLSSEARQAVVRSGDAVAVDGCNRDFQDRIATRRILISSKQFTQNAYRRLNLTPEELELRLEFYNEQLRELPLPDCRKSDDLLTDDPDVPIRYPEPLSPADVKNVVPKVSEEGAEPKEEGQP